MPTRPKPEVPRRLQLIDGGDEGGSPPEDRIAWLKEQYLADASSLFDHIIERCGKTPNERILVAYVLWDRWSVAHTEDGYRRHDLNKAVGFEGPMPVPILRDYSRKIDMISQYPIKSGDRVFTIPFAFFSEHGVRFAVSVDNDAFGETAERDRVFASAGWNVYRFGDREMHRDPYRVLTEIQARLYSADWLAEAPNEPGRKAEAEKSFASEMVAYDVQMRPPPER